MPLPSNTRSMTVRILTAFASRMILNTARRFIYPFAPALSRGLDVPLAAVTSIIAANQFTGLLSLIFGPLADRLGYRALMLGGLGVLVLGMALAGIFPVYWAVLAGLFLAGCAKAMFDPAILAYAGKRIPFERRGLAVGLLEMSWALSSLVGIPLIGLLMAAYGWRSPFWVLGTLALAAMGAVRLLIAKSDGDARPEHRASLLTAWLPLLKDRTAAFMLAFIFCFSCANDNLFVVYGVWLEKNFALSLAGLGLATTVIGAAELAGEGLTATLSDRLGLRVSVPAGVLATAVCYGALPFLESGLTSALIGLFALFVAVEFTIVTCLSLCTELRPDARATMLAGYFAAASLGRMSGALLGGISWNLGEMTAVCTGAALISLVGFLCLMAGLRQWIPEGRHLTTSR